MKTRSKLEGLNQEFLTAGQWKPQWVREALSRIHEVQLNFIQNLKCLIKKFSSIF